MWEALCRDFLGSLRLRLATSPDHLAEALGFTLGQAIEHLRAVAERDHAPRDVGRTAQPTRCVLTLLEPAATLDAFSRSRRRIPRRVRLDGEDSYASTSP